LIEMLSGATFGFAAPPLKHKDVIELAGVRMEFATLRRFSEAPDLHPLG